MKLKKRLSDQAIDTNEELNSLRDELNAKEFELCEFEGGGSVNYQTYQRKRVSVIWK